MIQPTQTVLIPIKTEDMEPHIPEPIEPLPAPFDYNYPVQPPLDPESDYLVQMDAQLDAEYEYTQRLLDETQRLIAQLAATNARAMRRLMEESAVSDEVARVFGIMLRNVHDWWARYISGSEELFTRTMNGEPAYPTGWVGEIGESSDDEREVEEEEEEEEVEMAEAVPYPPPQNKRTRDEANEDEDDANERPVKRPRVREVYRRALEQMRSEVPPMPSKTASDAAQGAQENNEGNQPRPPAPQSTEDARPPVLYGPESQFVYIRPVVIKPRVPEQEAPAPAPAAMEVVPAPELVSAADAPPARESIPMEVPAPAAPIYAEAHAPEPVQAYAPLPHVPVFPLLRYRNTSTYQEAIALGWIPEEGLAPVNGEASSTAQALRHQNPIRTIDGKPPRHHSDIDVDVTMSDSTGSPPLDEAGDEDVPMADMPGRSWRADVDAYAKAQAQQQEAMRVDVFGPVQEPLPTPQRDTAVGPIRSTRSPHRRESWPTHAFNGSPTRGSFQGTPYGYNRPLSSARPSAYIRYGPPASPVPGPSSSSSTRRILLENQAYAYPRPADQQVTDSEDGGTTDEDKPVFAVPAVPQYALPPTYPASFSAPASAQSLPASTTGLRPGTPRPTQDHLDVVDGRGVVIAPRKIEDIMESGTDAELQELRETGISRSYDFGMMHIPPAGTNIDFGLPPTPPARPRHPGDWLGLFS